MKVRTTKRYIERAVKTTDGTSVTFRSTRSGDGFVLTVKVGRNGRPTRVAEYGTVGAVKSALRRMARDAENGEFGRLLAARFSN